MKHSVCTILLVILLIVSAPIYAKDAPALKLGQEITLPNVKGRIDHLSIDSQKRRLFIAALGNNSVEVVDLNSGTVIRSITGFAQPQGVLYIPESNKLYVTNAGNGRCDIFEGDSFKLIKSLQFSSDTDNIRYDSTTKCIYVGYGSGGIGIIDIANDTLAGDIKLSGHPEAFEIDQRNGKIFVNVPESRQIAVVDIKRRVIESNWNIKGASDNFSMALDGLDNRLLIGCREPARLLVIDTRTGEIISEVKIDDDADDVFYDLNKRLFVISCGSGYIDIVQKANDSLYLLVEKIPSARGARTSLFVPESGLLYLAVPADRGKEAKINVYGYISK